MRFDKDNVVQIGRPDEPRFFTLSEANAALDLIKPITKCTAAELETVKSRLGNMLPSDPRVTETEQCYEKLVRNWISKMNRLGVIVKGLWLIDFDTGDGYFCWKFPERNISYYHSYNGGFVERTLITNVIETLNPDWADGPDWLAEESRQQNSGNRIASRHDIRTD